MGRLVAPEEFWIELQAGASVATASQASGVSYYTGYRWLAEADGPDALGLAFTRGRPWGGRKSEEVRDVFWAGLRRGATITAAARAAGVARQTGAVWLTEAGGVRPRVIDLKLEAAVIPGSGRRGSLTWWAVTGPRSPASWPGGGPTIRPDIGR